MESVATIAAVKSASRTQSGTHAHTVSARISVINTIHVREAIRSIKLYLCLSMSKNFSTCVCARARECVSVVGINLVVRVTG